MGFVFIRFNKGPQPSVAELMARFAPELSHYKIEDIVPAGGFYDFTTNVNWKSVRDVDNEGYHVAMAHPALQDLYGATYYDEPFEGGVSRSTGTYSTHGGRRWSVRHYLKHAPVQTSLPEDLRRRWSYFGLFPNCVIAITPEDRPVLSGVSPRREQDAAAGRRLLPAPRERGRRGSRVTWPSASTAKPAGKMSSSPSGRTSR